jgi:CRP/FNR family transcriptional regulator, cyclic AMP receptor protein
VRGSFQPAIAEPLKTLQDPLAFLPCSTIRDYRKKEQIYDEDQPATSIYMVVSGKITVCRVAPDGSEVVVDIYRSDEFFGESALLNRPFRLFEQASALEKATVMSWSVSEIEDIAMRQPCLTMALLQIVTQRALDLSRRIESFSLESIERRLARALLHFSERLGVPEEDGSVRILPLTHELLSQYVGASRVLVTGHMNRLRAQGLVRYSRKGIVLSRSVLREWLDAAPDPPRIRERMAGASACSE